MSLYFLHPQVRKLDELVEHINCCCSEYDFVTDDHITHQFWMQLTTIQTSTSSPKNLQQTKTPLRC